MGREGCEIYPGYSYSTSPGSLGQCATRGPVQVEQLKEENRALMEELVMKKMALAEAGEMHAKLKRDLLRQTKHDKVWPRRNLRVQGEDVVEH